MPGGNTHAVSSAPHLRSHPRLRNDHSHRSCDARVCRTGRVVHRKHLPHVCIRCHEHPQRHIIPSPPGKRHVKHHCSRAPHHLDEFRIRGDCSGSPHHDRGLLRHLVTGLHHPGDRLPTSAQEYPRHAELHQRQRPPVRSNRLSARYRATRALVVYGL